MDRLSVTEALYALAAAALISYFTGWVGPGSAQPEINALPIEAEMQKSTGSN